MDRLARTILAIDVRNTDDPNTIVIDGVAQPKELAHAELVTQWVRKLRPDASEALLLAARGHHLRRWVVPRSSYPAGRSGYLKWRRDLHRLHAEELAAILRDCGYDDATIDRVGALVRKEGLGRAPHDPEVQALEDALCLVFLETQFATVAERLDDEKMVDVLAKTAKKMSPAALEFAGTLPIDDAGRALLARALAQ
jgi:hypothetical protein